MFCFKKYAKLKDEVKALKDQIGDLVRLLGFERLAENERIEAEPAMGCFFTNGKHIFADKTKQPVTKHEFNLLLKHLSLELKPKRHENIPAEIAPIKKPHAKKPH